MDLTDPFSFTPPPQKDIDRRLREKGGFRIFPFHKFTGAFYSYGEVADTLDINKFLTTDPHNLVDEISKIHDAQYFLAKSKDELKKADENYIEMIDKLKPFMNLREKGEGFLASQAFNIKKNVGMYKDPDWNISDTDREILNNYIATTVNTLQDKYKEFAIANESSLGLSINTNLFSKTIQDFINVNEPMVRRFMFDSLPSLPMITDIMKPLETQQGNMDITLTIREKEKVKPKPVIVEEKTNLVPLVEQPSLTEQALFIL